MASNTKSRGGGNKGPAGAEHTTPGNPDLDGMIAEWGARLFYTPIRGQNPSPDPQFATAALALQASANAVRNNLRTVVGRSSTPVVVKITGGGRGMKAIAAHFRYIGRLGDPAVGGKGRTLEMEDQDGNRLEGRAAVESLVEDWRLAGTYIPDVAERREAFNVIFSMPPGTPPEAVLGATRETARELFAGHAYVMALHQDQGAPHVHLSVRAEGRAGVRLNPRKADLENWRAVFAGRLHDRGIQASATRQATRLRNHSDPSLWEKRAESAGRLKRVRPATRSAPRALRARADALKAWGEITKALARSPDPSDQALARDSLRYIAEFAPGGERAARLAADKLARAERQAPSGSQKDQSRPPGQRDRSRSPER